MIEMKPKHVYLPFIPAGKTAVTIYPFIFWSKKKTGWNKNDIIVHEMYHWNEQNHSYQAQWKYLKHLELGSNISDGRVM